VLEISSSVARTQSGVASDLPPHSKQCVTTAFVALANPSAPGTLLPAVKNISPELLNEVTRRLAAEFQPEQVWLFGSHAWGQPDEGSDLDLLVVVPHSDERPVRRAQRAHRCLSGIGVATDILVKTRAEVERYRHVRPSLSSLILRRGRLIYG